MNLDDLNVRLGHIANWGVSTWPGRIVVGLILVVYILSRLAESLKYIGKAMILILPLVLVIGSAYLFEKPRTFDTADSVCATAVSAVPAAQEIGRGVTAGSVVPVELRLKSSNTDLSSLEGYWSVRCALFGSFEDHGSTIRVGVIDYASRDQAAGRVDTSTPTPTPSLPGETNVLIGPAALNDGTTAAAIQFASGRLFANIVVDIPGQSGELGNARDLALRVAAATSVRMPATADLDTHRPFRNYLGWVWAAWLAFLAFLPAIMLIFLGDRLELLLNRMMVLGLDLLDVSGLGAKLGLGPTPPVVGRSLVARIRVIRAARNVSNLVSVAVWAATLVVLLRWLPAQFPLWSTSVILAGAYLAAELIRTALLGVIPRYRYLRITSWGEGLRRFASRVIEAIYISLVIYTAGRLSIAWIWIPFNISGSSSPIGPIAYVWIFGPAAFILVSGIFKLVSRRVQARDSEAILRKDVRPHVLYLRSFGDDRHEIPVHSSVFESIGQLFDWSQTLRFEEVLVRRLWRYGPVLAVGRPGERRAPIGAARLYYPDDAWQGPVRNWVESSALVVVTMGKTPNLGWELHMLRDLGALWKTIIIIPPTRDSQMRAHLLATELDLHGPWSDYEGIRIPLVFGFDSDGEAHPVYGDVSDDVAYELALDAVVHAALGVRGRDIAGGGVGVKSEESSGGVWH